MAELRGVRPRPCDDFDGTTLYGMSGPVAPTSSRRLALGLVAAALAIGHLAAADPRTVALFVDQQTVASTLSSETLDPPTSLTASAAPLFRVDLAWTPTVDARATGYRVLRSTTSGSGYVEVAVVNGAGTSSYQDTVPLLGTYYYVVRSYFGSWTSANSNEASVLVL